MVGSSPEPMVQLRDGPRHQPSDRGDTQARPRRAPRQAARGRARRASEGARRARHARRPRPQRCRACRALRHRVRRGADDARALLARHAPHEPGHRRTGAREVTGRRAAGDVPRRARSAARPRCARWRSSTSSNPRSEARTPGSSGYLDFSGNLDTAIAIRTMFWRGTPGDVAGRCGDRRRLRPRRRRPGMPQQGASVALGSSCREEPAPASAAPPQSPNDPPETQ